MNNARDNILQRLRNSAGRIAQIDSNSAPPIPGRNDDTVETLRGSLAGTGTQVYVSSGQNWVSLCAGIFHTKGIRRLLYSAGTSMGKQLEEAFSSTACPMLVRWQDTESFRDTLWSIDASLTSVQAGIASTGSLMIGSSTEEPRVMSLVPPIHIALLDAGRIYPTLEQALAAEVHVQSAPRNFVLISGPSKTADIEGSLVHGIHGPKELIVIICQEQPEGPHGRFSISDPCQEA